MFRVDIIEVRRAETIAAVNKHLGLRRHGVKIYRCAEQKAVAVGQLSVNIGQTIIEKAELRSGGFAAGLTGYELELV